MCLGLEPGLAEWKVQTNPLSYGGTPMTPDFYFTAVIAFYIGH